MAKRARRAGNCFTNQSEDAGSLTFERLVAPDPAEAEQHEGEHRVPRGGRMVIELLLASDQPLAVGRREEEAAALLVCEELDREPREAVRLLEPTQVAGCDVQLVEPVRDVG